MHTHIFCVGFRISANTHMQFCLLFYDYDSPTSYINSQGISDTVRVYACVCTLYTAMAATAASASAQEKGNK